MSAKIPTLVADTTVQQVLQQAGIKLGHRGKVRDTYLLPDPALLFVVATDRVSIFDFVLPAVVPHKGALLTALTVFWLSEVLNDVPHHLVAYGRGIDEYLPPELRGNAELHKRALVVRKLKMVPIECIVRGYLTGSGLKSYEKNHHVCGIPLPEGLHDGSRILPAPIFTPTTKAESGHDEHVPTDEVIQRYGRWTRDRSLAYYQRLAEVAESKGLVLADTKFEFGEGGVLADEVGTPDSSRFWDTDECARDSEQKKSPPPFDKELVRSWGKQNVLLRCGQDGLVSMPYLDPDNPAHVAFVHSRTVPDAVLNETTSRYRTVVQRLTGLTLEEFQKFRLRT